MIRSTAAPIFSGRFTSPEAIHFDPGDFTPNMG
jgi:hypothetical protein